MEKDAIEYYQSIILNIRQKAATASVLLVDARDGRPGQKVYTIFDIAADAMDDMRNKIITLENNISKLKENVALLLEQ
jgi:hypothetical protein